MYQTFHYKPKYDELNIRIENITTAMGYPDGKMNDGYSDILNELIDNARNIVSPECGYVILPQNRSSASMGVVTLDSVDFKTDKIVAGPLKKMSGAAILVGTVGPQFDIWSKETFASGDPLAGYMIDLLGSEIAESIADWLENRIVNYAAEQGMKCSNRYSPGYCGWSVAEQHKLFKFLPKDFCWIRLTESSLMKPHKSVSAIIGISSDIKRRDYPCDVCNVEHCYKNRDKKLKATV